MEEMTKKAILTICLVPEAIVVKTSSIKQDIQKESRDIIRAIPWAADIEDITILS